jgi:hypothetical protein
MRRWRGPAVAPITNSLRFLHCQCLHVTGSAVGGNYTSDNMRAIVNGNAKLVTDFV